MFLTEHIGNDSYRHIGNTFAPKRLSALVIRPVSYSKKPRSYCIKFTSQTLSLTSLMPTFWPANTMLRLILRLPKHRRPHSVCDGHIMDRVMQLKGANSGRA